MQRMLGKCDGVNVTPFEYTLNVPFTEVRSVNGATDVKMRLSLMKKEPPTNRSFPNAAWEEVAPEVNRTKQKEQ